MTKASLRTLLPMLVSYLGSGGSMLVSAAAQLVTFAILARMMGTTQFATYVTISAFTNVFLQICGLGSQESMVRRVAREPGFYPVMLGHSLLLSGGTGLVLVLAGLFGIPLLLNLSPAEAPSFGALALLLVTNIVLVKIMGMATAAYIAHSRFAQANSVDVAFAVVRGQRHRPRPRRVGIPGVLSDPEVAQDAAASVHRDVRGDLALALPGEAAHLHPQLRGDHLVDPVREGSQPVGDDAGAGQQEPCQRPGCRDVITAGWAGELGQDVQDVVGLLPVGIAQPRG